MHKINDTKLFGLLGALLIAKANTGFIFIVILMSLWVHYLLNK